MTPLTPRPPRRTDAPRADRAPDRPAPRPSRLPSDDTVFAFVAFVLGAGLLVWRWHVADTRGLPTPNGQLAWGGGLIALAAYFIASGKVRGAVGMVQGLAPGVFARWQDRRAAPAADVLPAVAVAPVVAAAPDPAQSLGAAVLAKLAQDPDALARALRTPTGQTERFTAAEWEAARDAARKAADADRGEGA